jgi:hypothetical protein
MKRMETHVVAVVGVLLLSIPAANAQEGAALVKKIYQTCIHAFEEVQRERGTTLTQSYRLHCACLAGSGVTRAILPIPDRQSEQANLACLDGTRGEQ